MTTRRPDASEIRTTCPRDCYDRCGLLVRVRNGVVDRVAGDPAHPHTRGTICGKCATAYNGLWLDDTQRIQTPLRRAGVKGSGAFTPIGWDAALEEIAARFTEVSASHGAHTILHAHYQGTYAVIACQFPNRFFHRLGATEVDPGTICDKAGHVALTAMYGTSFVGFDPRTAQAAGALFVWGANPSHSGPVTDRYWLDEFKGVTVVVDPLKTDTARRADLHLQLRPGTDVALVYGMLAVMLREHLLDTAFLARHVRGWAAVAAEIAALTPARAASITGVPLALIEQAARLYAGGPCLLWMGIGLQRQRHGGDVVRAVALLPPATGNLGRVGTGFLYMNGYESVDLPVEWLTMPALAPGPLHTISHMDLAATLADPRRAHAFVNWNTNVLASAADQGRLRAALQRDGLFTVVIDPFLTDTARHADIVLPAAGFLEFDDLVFSYFQRTVSAQVKVREPVGDALPNQEICRRLARCMGMTDAALFESDEQLIARVLGRVAPGLDFDALKAAGTAFVHATPRVQFADLRFATPSGLIEIDADAFTAAGLAAAPRVTDAGAAAPGSFRLLSPSHAWLMNSTYGNDPAIRRRLGPASLLMNAADAEALGVQDGAEVDVRHHGASLPLQVSVTDATPPGVLVCYKSRWPGLDPSGHNVNVLNPGLRADLGDSTAVNSLVVTLAPRGAR